MGRRAELLVGLVLRMEVIHGGGRWPGDWVDYLSPKEGG